MASEDTASTEDTLRASNHLLRAILGAHSERMRGGEPRSVVRRLLTVAMEMTGSAGGLIGEVVPSSSGAPSFQPIAHLPGDEGGSAWALPLEPEASTHEPRDLRALMGAVSLANGLVILSGPGVPTPLLGLPLESEGSRVGILGLAGRPGGYDAQGVEWLQPLVLACADLLLGWRNERRKVQSEQETRHHQEADAERLRLLMDSIRDGVWDTDLVTGLTTANRRWLDMLGYDEHDIMEINVNTWQDLSHPDDLPECMRCFMEHLQGHTPFAEYEQRMRRKNGEWMWVLTRGQVVARDAQGRPTRVVGTNVDITARKLAEHRLRTLVDTLPDIVFRIGADGTYRDYFARDESRLVVPGNQIIGFNLRRLPLPPAQLDKLFFHLGRAIREGTLEVVEYALPMPEGLHHFEMRLLRSAPDEVFTIVRDITERKVAEERLRAQEEELRRHRDSLEALVRSRSEKLLQATLDLEEQQAQLIQTEKLASLGQMAAGVAHEINNPVSYVMSNLGTLDQYVSSPVLPLLRLLHGLMEAGEASPGSTSADLLERARALWEQEDVDYLIGDMPELIEESLAGTRRIKEIAQSLRSFAREDSGEPQLVDVNTELSSTLKIVWNELKYKCEVKRDFGPLPPVSCHPTQIAQVFTNLLVNAAQAIETRGEIRIRTRHEGNEVVVEIADTGQGMTQETISKLFTPFFTTKPRGQGTGLGLSVSYGIITRHKGRIEVQSDPGKGSTFIVRLPAAQR